MNIRGIVYNYPHATSKFFFHHNIHHTRRFSISFCLTHALPSLPPSRQTQFVATSQSVLSADSPVPQALDPTSSGGSLSTITLVAIVCLVAVVIALIGIAVYLRRRAMRSKLRQKRTLFMEMKTLESTRTSESNAKARRSNKTDRKTWIVRRAPNTLN